MRQAKAKSGRRQIRIKALLVFFSGTGMTGYYASLLRERFLARGIQCDCRSIEEITDVPALWQRAPLALNYTMHATRRNPLSSTSCLNIAAAETAAALPPPQEDPGLAHLREDWAAYNLIGFGSPVYEFRPAPVMIRFLLDLPAFSGKRQAFSFATHDGARGDYVRFMERLLADKGFIYRGHVDHTFLCSAMFILRRRFNAAKSGRILAAASVRANHKIDHFLDRLTSEAALNLPRRVSRPGFLGSLASMPWRLLFSPGMDYLLNRFLFGFGLEYENCIQCYTCIRQCPQGLMVKDEDGYPLREQHCMYCLRCLNWCPTGALYFSRLTRGKARFPGPEALLDAALDYHPERWVKKKRPGQSP